MHKELMPAKKGWFYLYTFYDTGIATQCWLGDFYMRFDQTWH